MAEQKSILSLYLNEVLHFTEHESKIVYHLFALFVYAFPLVGAMIADSCLGKFKTILYISVIYACGSVFLALSAIGVEALQPRTSALVGLALIAFGSGGIKPCVAAFGGDQFKMPQQQNEMDTFFHFFYFSINAGSLLSMFVTPLLRKGVHCFGETSCYPLAFFVPGVLMIVAVVLFLVGKPLYVIQKPQGNMVVKVSNCIGTAIKEKIKWKGPKKEHWLDYAIEKHGAKTIKDIKILLAVLYIYLPLPIFWALFEQQATGWTFQARRMDGDIGNFFTILPDMMQLVNPLLILIFIPLFNYYIYPALGKIGLLKSPLQRIAAGGMMASISFIITALIALILENTYPVLPSEGKGQLRVYNVLPCDLTLKAEQLNNGNEIKIPQLDFATFYLSLKDVNNYDYAINGNCYTSSGSFKVMEANASGYYFYEKDKEGEFMIDNIAKLITGLPDVRTIINLNSFYDGAIDVKFCDSDRQCETFKSDKLKNVRSMTPGLYTVYFADSPGYTQKFSLGGVYVFAAIATAKGSFKIKAMEAVTRNSMHMLWLLPQYIVITAGEVMLAVTGIEFSYSQSPLSMKSVLQASWLLTIAFGQFFVVLIELMNIFKKQSAMFFLYACVMAIDMVVFIFMSMNYTYIENPD